MGRRERPTGIDFRCHFSRTVAQRWPRRRLTSEVALLCERDPQVTVLPAKAVGEEGGEGSCMFLEELEPHGQPLQGQGQEGA